MSDDWRLQVDLHESGTAHKLTERLNASRLEHDLEDEFHDKVVISRDGPQLFCYTGTREQAERVQRLIGSIAQEHDWQVETRLFHWHPTAEAWEDPDKPLPDSDAERAREHAELIQRERAEVQERGYPEFEVRVECPTEADAERFALELRSEGLPIVQRHNYLLIGTADEDEANALAERLRSRIPAGSVVSAEGTLQAADAEQPPSPFWFLGGLGG
jgi:hypothetical protein